MNGNRIILAAHRGDRLNCPENTMAAFERSILFGVDMIETDKYGYYHATNEGGYISWADFAREIFRAAGKAVEIVPVTTAEYGASKARRPLNSRLDKRKLAENGFRPLPAWQDALKRYLKELEMENGTDHGNETRD